MIQQSLWSNLGVKQQTHNSDSTYFILTLKTHRLGKKCLLKKKNWYDIQQSSSKDGYCSTIADVSLTRLHNKNMEGWEKKRKKKERIKPQWPFNIQSTSWQDRELQHFRRANNWRIFFPLLTLIFVNRQSLQLITELNLCLEEYHKYIMYVLGLGDMA